MFNDDPELDRIWYCTKCGTEYGEPPAICGECGQMEFVEGLVSPVEYAVWEILYRDTGEYWGMSNKYPEQSFLNPEKVSLRPLVAYNPRTKEVIY